jgi:hypothetical protein
MFPSLRDVYTAPHRRGEGLLTPIPRAIAACAFVLFEARFIFGNRSDCTHVQANDIENMSVAAMNALCHHVNFFDVKEQFLVLRRTGPNYIDSVWPTAPKVRLNLRAADPTFLAQRHRPPYQFIITSSVLRHVSILLQSAIPIYTTMSRLRLGGLEVSVEID